LVKQKYFLEIVKRSQRKIEFNKIRIRKSIKEVKAIIGRRARSGRFTIEKAGF